VGPPEEDIEFLRHFSQKILNPPLVIGDDFKVVPNTPLVSEHQVILENKLVEDKVMIEEIPAPLSVNKQKSRKIKRDDIEIHEAEVCKRSVICHGDKESDNERRGSLKRKRVVENNKPKRESIDFGPCATFPFKSRKVFSSKASTKVSSPILK
jgi:hypothetical protein